MKKTVAIIMLFALLSVTLFGCGSSGSGGSNSIITNGENVDITTEPSHQTEVPSGYVGIYTVEDLKNAGLNQSGNYILMNDLDLSSEADWESIRNTGIFDGNNYTISNLKSTHGGIFERSNDVSNLNVKDIKIEIKTSNLEPPESSSQKSVGVAVGGISNDADIVKNCSSSGVISIIIDSREFTILKSNYLYTTFLSVGIRIGGIVARADTSITNCVNQTNISVENKLLEHNPKQYYGITDDSWGDARSIYIGGIAGSIGGDVSVANCENRGNLSLSSVDESLIIPESLSVGGIFGYSPLEATLKVSKCKNSGNILSAGVAGGIIGYCHSCGINSENVNACYNSGKVESQSKKASASGNEGTSAGGIVGAMFASEETLILNCYNVGACSGADNCGEILGLKKANDTISIQYCAYNNASGLNITGSSAMFADNKAMSLEEMKNLSNYPFTNKDSDWKNGSGDYPYPVFK